MKYPKYILKDNREVSLELESLDIWGDYIVIVLRSGKGENVEIISNRVGEFNL